jgi:hypothetical protein
VANPADWTTIPLLYKAWGGDYAVTRTDRSPSATEVGFLGGPTVGAAGNGKTQFDSGAVTIQTGNNRLLVYGLEEASRSADLISGAEHTILHNERSTFGNQKNSVYWCDASPADTQNQGLLAISEPPGQDYSVTSWPSKIDLSEDADAYTYLRAVHLEANGSKSAVDYLHHQDSWTREVFFFRPKIAVVHDRTRCLINPKISPSNYEMMIWDMPRTPVQVVSGVPSGMTRYDVTDPGNVYHGAFWSVLPSSAAVNLVDHDGLGFLFKGEVSSPVQNAESCLSPANSKSQCTANNWMAVFDAATSASAVNTVTNPSAANADCVQFNDANATNVCFANLDPVTSTGSSISIPENGASQVFVAGLTPKASYGVSTKDGNITITSPGTLTATPAGVLVIGSTPLSLSSTSRSSANQHTKNGE